jgi:hypothetical protein
MKTKFDKLLLDFFQFVDISRCVAEFKTTDVYSNLDLSRVKDNRYGQLKDENEKVMLQTRPNNLIH